MAANKKIPHNWNRVKPGDIISFRYKSKKNKKLKVQSILVLNPRLPVSLKDGSVTRHLVGVKIEESNKMQLKLTTKQVSFLEKIGNFIKIDEENNLYRLEIFQKFLLNETKGTKSIAWQHLSRSLNIQGQYRTYDYKIARKSAVYLEPIRVFTAVETKDEEKIKKKKRQVEKTMKQKEMAKEVAKDTKEQIEKFRRQSQAAIEQQLKEKTKKK